MTMRSVVRARVGPRLLDPGKGDGPGADVEGALGDCGGERGNLFGEVASGDRVDAAADDFQARRAQRGRRDGSLEPGHRADLDPGQLAAAVLAGGQHVGYRPGRRRAPDVIEDHIDLGGGPELIEGAGLVRAEDLQVTQAGLRSAMVPSVVSSRAA
jgi:hypothetical protein